MTRMHIHISVDDIEKSIGFYSTLFGAPPTKKKDAYAQWRLEDPAVNFAISKGCGEAGIEHLGIESHNRDGLGAISDRLKTAGANTLDQTQTTCCYAVSDKSWVEDPSGVKWETFYTHGDAAEYGVDATRDELRAMKESAAQ